MAQNTVIACALSVVLVAAAVWHSSATPSHAAGAGTLPRSSFPMSNARVVSQSGQNTAIVVLGGSAKYQDRTGSVRKAARQWCGGNAQVSIVGGNDDRNSRSPFQYLVKCR